MHLMLLGNSTLTYLEIIQNLIVPTSVVCTTLATCPNGTYVSGRSNQVYELEVAPLRQTHFARSTPFNCKSS